jgi:hypothetical protein
MTTPEALTIFRTRSRDKPQLDPMIVRPVVGQFEMGGDETDPLAHFSGSLRFGAFKVYGATSANGPAARVGKETHRSCGAC